MAKELTPTPRPKELADLETVLTEIIPIESEKDQIQANVEIARSKALKEAMPAIKPLDRAENSKKKQAFSLLDAGKKIKGFFPKGMKSVHTMAGTAGFKKGPTHLKLAKGTTEEDILPWLEAEHPELVRVVKNIHRTKLRQKAAKDPAFIRELKRRGARLVQTEHKYIRTKTAKRSNKATATKAGKRSTAKKEVTA